MEGGGKRNPSALHLVKDDDCRLRSRDKKEQGERETVGGRRMNNVGCIPIKDGCFSISQ